MIVSRRGDLPEISRTARKRQAGANLYTATFLTTNCPRIKRSDGKEHLMHRGARQFK